MYRQSLLLAFILLCLNSIIFAQKTPCTGASVKDLVPQAITRQSSFFIGDEPDKCGLDIGLVAHDFDPVHTGFENNPWLEFDLKSPAQLTGIQITYPTDAFLDGFQQFYIIFSQSPLTHADLATTLANPAVEHIFVSEPIASGKVIPLDNRNARYVRIQSAQRSELHCDKLALFGNPVLAEIAGNNIDDDCDGKIDLDDEDIKPVFRNVLLVPGDKSGKNGSIVVEASGQNLRYSLDGGRSFHKPTQQEGDYMTISAPPGKYDLVLSGDGDVTTDYEYNPLVVAAPDETSCGNGDFSQGWNNWNGWRGTHNANGGTTITNNGIDPAGVRHAILGSSLANDPNVGANIPLTSPSGNARFARLGSNVSNLGGLAQNLNFCFQVTPANANFSFWIAAVLFNSGQHNAPNSAFFSFSVSVGGAVLAGNTFNPGPFGNQNTQTFNNNTYFLPWTCVAVNLNNFIGQQVCVSFTSAGCNQTIHGGYAYIDGLCSNFVMPTIAVPSNVCMPQTANAIAIGGQGINRYQWQVEMIDSDGNPIPNTAFLTAPQTLLPIQPLTNIVGFWQSNAPNQLVKCGQRFRVTLWVNGSNRCNPVANRIAADFTANCAPPDMNYCDLVICTNPGTVVMQGTGSCSTCQYNWSPSNNLNSGTVAFPTITNIAGWDATYNVTVTEVGGCSKTESVQVTSVGINGNLTVVSKCLDKCNVELVATYLSTKPITVANVAVTATSTNPVQSHVLNFTSVQILPSGAYKYIFTSGPIANTGTGNNGDNPINYTVTISSKPPTGCLIGSNCSNTLTATVSVPRGLFWGPQPTGSPYIPNIFCMNPSNPVNGFFNPFFVTNAHAVYWMEMEIYDKWGGLVYKNEYPNESHPFEPDCNTTSGYAGNESGFPWNGRWNNTGAYVSIGPYVYIIRYRNCSGDVFLKGDVLFWNCGEPGVEEAIEATK